MRRTREALRDALLTLLEERGWDGIDIQSLCERADVGRSTFYLHFANKEELLATGFSDLRARLQQGGDATGTRLSFVHGLVEHVHEHQQVFRAMLRPRAGTFVQERFRNLLVEMVTAELGGRGWRTGATAHYLGGALFQLLCWWLNERRPQRGEEIEALFEELSRPVLAGASPGSRSR